jgi:formamidopyrimidine-DNA glycosylase
VVPEYPDIENYVDALKERIVGLRLDSFQFLHPFILRTVEPPEEMFRGRMVEGVERQEKRIAIGFSGELYAVMHLMVAGRLHWTSGAASPGRVTGRPRPGKGGTLFEAVFVASSSDASPPVGSLRLTEAGSRRMAAVHLVSGREGLKALSRGGLELFSCSEDEFSERLRSENHTVKRALTDPRLVSGVGNAYSDEILHRARMSPFRQTGKMTSEELRSLLCAARETLSEWRERLSVERAGSFPGRVTAFHELMAAHGRYGMPCPVCGTPIQRVQYTDNECDYCPVCQADGTVYADRGLSRLLKSDWPRTVEELEKTPGTG